MNISIHDFIDLLMFVVQLVLMGIGWKIRAEISEMRTHMYEHFLTKKDFHSLWSNR